MSKKVNLSRSTLALKEGHRFEAEVFDARHRAALRRICAVPLESEPKVTAISGPDGKIVIEGLKPGEMGV